MQITITPKSGGTISITRNPRPSITVSPKIGVAPSRKLIAGTGLDGGGDLSADRTIGLSAASQSSLGKADSAIQPTATDASGFGFFLDQDDLTDDDATKAASQQSVKANIDARAPRGKFGTVALMLADADFGYSASRFVVAAGQIIEAGGFRYEVAASGASDQHLETAGGVKLYIAPGTSVDGRAMGLESTQASDQSAAVQKWFDVCAALGVAPSLSAPLSVRIDSPVTYDPSAGTVPADIDLRLLTLTGAGLRVGSNAGFMRETNFFAPKIIRTPAWDADSDASMLGSDAGLILYNFGTSKVFLNVVSGFTVGVAYHSENYWWAYNTVYGGHLTDNRYDEVLRTVLGSVVPGGEFCNENLFVGGARRETSAVNALGNAYGTVLTAGSGAYKGQNANRWLAPCYEMGAPGGTTWRTAVLMAGAGSRCRWENVRHESGIGPFGIADARGNMNNAFGCEYSASYEAGNAGQGAGWLQVNGAYGNIAAGPLIPRPRLAISPMASMLSSGGASTAPRLAGPFILKRGVTATPLRTGTAATDFVTNRNALQSANSIGVLLEIDASKIKTFAISQDAIPGFGGRFFAQAFDASGAMLTGNATDSWGSEPYVKFSTTQTTTTLFGGGYWQQSDNAAQSLILTCRDEVAKLICGFVAGAFPLALKGIEIAGYPTAQLAGSSTSGIACIGLTVPTTDDGRARTASVNPATAGVHGQYASGEFIGNSAPAAGSPAGWVCSTAGWLAAAWAISTAYAVPGHVVINDSGKAYALVTAGTSASSGGPTGTGSSITDGTCVWQYIGTQAAFLPTYSMPLENTATYDPPSIAAGAVDTTQTMTVTGAALGDIVDVSFSVALAGARLEAWVSASNTVSYRFSNPTGSAIDLGSGTVKARVRK